MKTQKRQTPISSGTEPEELLPDSRIAQMTKMLRALSSESDPVKTADRVAKDMHDLYEHQGFASISLRNLGPGEYRVMRLVHGNKAVADGFESTAFAADAKPHTGGFIGEILAMDRPVVFRDIHLLDDPVLGDRLSPYRCIFASPVFDQGRALNWVLFLNDEPEDLSDAEIEMWLLFSNLSGGWTQSKRVTKELEEAHAWIQHEIDEIAKLQKGLLPSAMPDILGVDLAAMQDTFDRAGGDYYDVFPWPAGGNGDRYALIMADASGHGPSAAVVVAMLSTLLHTCPSEHARPAQVLAYLNNHLADRALNGVFVTAFFGIYHVRNRTLAYANAGHCLPILVEPGDGMQTFRLLEGYPLGVKKDCRFTEEERAIASGSRLLLYTDGITEAWSPKDEMFGVERLERAFKESAGDAAETLDSIQHQFRAHEAGRRPMDDQTMLVACFQ